MNKVTVGISGRHVHLSQNDLDTLFGEGYELTNFKDLSQPGQFACEEKVDIISSAGREIKGVRILGPVRNQTQIEISRSDAIRAKFEAPVRPSGDLKGSSACTVVGPKGKVELTEGVVVANRHIHLHTTDAEKMNLADKQIVSVKVDGEKGGILANVTVRVHDTYAMDFHVDTDDAAAFELNNGQEVEVIK